MCVLKGSEIGFFTWPVFYLVFCRRYVQWYIEYNPLYDRCRLLSAIEFQGFGCFE